MSISIEDPTIEDTYSAEIIQKARELSPEIDEYLISQSYLLEADQDVITPLWLRNKLIIRLVEQLADRGIIIDYPVDDLCDAPALVQMVLYLRSKFDNDNLYDFLKNRHELLEDIQGFIDADDDCVEDITAYCSSMLPLDEGWEFTVNTMQERPGMVHSDERFVEIVRGIIDKIDRLGDPDVLESSNRATAEQYIEYVGRRKQMITEIAKSIYAIEPIATESYTVEGKVNNTRSKIVDNLMVDFEKPLGRAAAVAAVSESGNISEVVNSVRAKYSNSWKHLLAYWLDPARAEELPDLATFAVMVATMFVDAGAGDDAKARVIDEFEKVVDLLGDRYTTIREMLDKALTNIVIQEDARKVTPDAAE